jgi:hypothetical protein
MRVDNDPKKLESHDLTKAKRHAHRVETKAEVLLECYTGWTKEELQYLRNIQDASNALIKSLEARVDKEALAAIFELSKVLQEADEDQLQTNWDEVPGLVEALGEASRFV